MLKIIQFPLLRILIAAVCVIAALNAAKGLTHLLRSSFPGLDAGLSGQVFALIEAFAMVIAVDLAYRIYVQFVERRPVTELSRTAALGELGAGILIGFGLFTATIGVLWALGYYAVGGVNRGTVMIAALAPAVAAAYGEEILMRGILFRITEEGLGTWPALVLSALLFGLAHAGNRHVTALSVAAVALEAGILLGAAYVLTRRLWLPIGIHFAWNFAQGGIYGVAVSGIKQEGLLRGELAGPELISGGSFGAEASVIAVVLCLLATGYLLLRAIRCGQVVTPLFA